MRVVCPLLFCAFAAGAIVLAPRHIAATSSAPTTSPTIAQFLGAASPLEVVAATKVDRIAWMAYEQGKRNVYTAAAPAFTPVRLTNFMKDDGVDLTEVKISADGSTVVFVRGSAANREGWHANPSGDPDGGEEAVWAARTANPGTSWRVVEANNVQLAPDGKSVVFAKDGQLYHALVSETRPSRDRSRGEAVHQGVGLEQQPELVARWREGRLRERSRRSRVRRGL